MLAQRQLPAGYLDRTGVLHRNVYLRALTGREEELLAAETSSGQNGAVQVTELLARCVVQLGELQQPGAETMRQLLVGDRQYLLLMLRQLTMGNRVQASLPCPWPGCGKGVDLDFNISDIPITSCADVRDSYDLWIPGSEDTPPLNVAYRLPTGADQEALQDVTGAAAVTQLLHRCVLRIGDRVPTGENDIAVLGIAVRRAIEQDMEARAPNLDLTMELRCPSCQRQFAAPFVLQDFFFGELSLHAKALYREVHYLAFHYHWSEHEIMQMTRTRRRQYINVLTNEIDKLNAAAE